MTGGTFGAIFIRDYGLPNWAGYTPVHLLVFVTACDQYAIQVLTRKLWAMCSNPFAPTA